MGGEEAFTNALIQGTAYRSGTCWVAQVSFVITLFETSWYKCCVRRRFTRTVACCLSYKQLHHTTREYP